MTWHDTELTSLPHNTAQPQSSQSLQLAVFHQSSPRLDVTLFILRLSFKSRHSSEPNYNPLTDAVSAVIAIPHNSPQQTLAAFRAELVNTMSNTCPALLTYSSYSHQIYSYTSHGFHQESWSRKIYFRHCKHNTQTRQGDSQSIYSGNKCHHQEVGSSAQRPMCPAFVIPVCINWPSVGHHPISARCTKVSVSCHHTVYDGEQCQCA